MSPPVVLDGYRQRLTARPLLLVELVPRLEVAQARDSGRSKQVFALWETPGRSAADRMPRVGLWVDTSEMTAEHTVDALMASLDEAVIPG